MRDVTSSLVAQEQEPVDEDIEDVDQEKRNGWMRDVTSSLVAQELEPVDNDRIQDVCSESRMESNGYKLAHSFKVCVTLPHLLKLYSLRVVYTCYCFSGNETKDASKGT